MSTPIVVILPQRRVGEQNSTAMTLSRRGLNLIKEFEGLRLEAYQCSAGKWTLGYGTTLGIVEGMTCTKEAAEAMLRRDVERFAAKVATAVHVPITQNQFDALVSFAYNVGVGAFENSTLLKKLNAGDDAGASGEFLKWIKANGEILGGLKRRRKAEQSLFETANA